MAASREVVEQDYVIEQVRQLYQCTVLWCEGRPCLEYDSIEELDKISDYVKTRFDKDLLDVFFVAVESIPQE
ncbi:hypothetical protein E0485_07925 [Paenibacillus albiflavus]|uniref:Uncharacterized protein n=1 Tax=Paenibacillus albiflavus TaxID=2545760 RepID=A0A4R4EGX9_9BACL|nr:hypothetical protein [Paenibacillus albiflavus]TCZ78420.1 hypothetical protein E0485_07925 [Paenibacillus albiflavus]